MDNATNRWLNKLAEADKAKGNTGSDYRLGQLLGVERQYVSKYRRGVIQMNDALAIRLAELLEQQPMRVIGEIHEELARDAREKKFWALTARNARKAAVILAVSMGALAPPKITNWEGEFGSPALAESGAERCILCKVRRGSWRRRFTRHWRRRRNRPPIPQLIPGRVALSDLAAIPAPTRLAA